MTELLHIIRVGDTLGEGIVWDGESRRVLWTDIHARRLHRYDPATDALETFATPERLCSFGLVQGRAELIAAFESGIGFHTPGTDGIAWLHRPTFAAPGIRFNDGRVDRQGRFWCGTMSEAETPAAVGSLYRLDRNGSASVHESGIAISNGICWSPDGTRFYFADSPLRTIFVYDFDPGTGRIANRRVFAHTPDGAYPDGANVDSQGHVWSAHWGAGCVVRYAPDGTVSARIDVPARQPTCVAFGGPDLDRLFVTSAREGLNADALLGQPHSGDVFVYKIPVPGLPDARYAFEKGRT